MLREQFNVRTYHDLANLSPAEIAQLETKLIPPLRRYVDGWIDKTQELDGQSSQPVGVSANAKAGEKANPLITEDGWKSFANFVVEFQVREIKGGAEEQRITVSYTPVKDGTWQEDKRTKPIVIPGEQLYRWMQNQVGEMMPQVTEPPEEKPPVGAKPAAALPVTVEIAQVQAFQPPQTETPIAIGKAGRPFQGFVRSVEPFALEVSFALTGPGATNIAEKQVAYSAQFYVRNLTTGAKTPLGDTEAAPLVAGESTYKAMLLQASLQPGVYRLRVLTTLTSTPPIVGYLEVPLFQVV